MHPQFCSKCCHTDIKIITARGGQVPGFLFCDTLGLGKGKGEQNMLCFHHLVCACQMNCKFWIKHTWWAFDLLDPQKLLLVSSSIWWQGVFLQVQPVFVCWHSASPGSNGTECLYWWFAFKTGICNVRSIFRGRKWMESNACCLGHCPLPHQSLHLSTFILLCWHLSSAIALCCCSS